MFQTILVVSNSNYECIWMTGYFKLHYLFLLVCYGDCEHILLCSFWVQIDSPMAMFEFIVNQGPDLIC